MTSEHSEPGHGDSPAAWTAVVVMLIGITAGTAGLFLEFTYPGAWGWLLWGGVVVFVVGLVLGFVLKLLGYGVDGPKSARQQHS